MTHEKYKMPVTNTGLLNICLQSFNGWLQWDDKSFTLHQLMDTAMNCMRYLTQIEAWVHHSQDWNTNYQLSTRQIIESKSACHYSGQQEYIHAFHALMECVDNYSEASVAKPREITKNEYAIYSCILSSIIMGITMKIAQEAE